MSSSLPPECLPGIRTGKQPADASDRELTARELAVLRMLADGEVTRGIAEQLNYSERTVKNIVRDVLVKLDCRTRAHATARAIRRGLI
jgi:DNA-binding NarL/FixJ family response regulator